MGERTELAITIATTGLAAYVGYNTPGLAGEEIAAVVPAFVGGLFAMRKENLVTVTEVAADLAGMDGADVDAWINADGRHATFFAEALEAAWSTLDPHKLRTLSHVLADGFQDDARLDVDQLVIKALRELDPPHIRVLSVLASAGWLNRANVLEELPELRDGLDALYTGLERTGCLARFDRPNAPPILAGSQPLTVTDFGRTCLKALRRADSGSLDQQAVRGIPVNPARRSSSQAVT